MQLQQVTIGKDLTFDLNEQGVSAGNPQPPFGESSEKIDLNKLLITNEIVTYFCRVSGRSMEPHMRDGDVLVVDKSIQPKVGKVVIAAINCEMTVKWLSEVDSQLTLTADNQNCLDLKVDDLGSGHECDLSVVKFFKGSQMRHLLPQQRILQAIPICKFIGGRLLFTNGKKNNNYIHL